MVWFDCAKSGHEALPVCVCLCVCARESEMDRETERERVIVCLSYKNTVIVCL